MTMISDVGGFFTGALYGSETGLFWGIKYNAMGVKILSPVHPVTIYALLGHILLWFAAKHYWLKWKKTPGKLATMLGIWFFTLEFLWQFFRGDETLLLPGGIRLEQLLSLLIVGSLMYWYRRRYR